MNFNIIHDIHMQLQVSLPIQILSILSTACTLLVIILVIYIIRRDNNHSENSGSLVMIPSDFEELIHLIKDWEFEKCKTLLSSFLLVDEYIILNMLVNSLQEDDLTIVDEEEELKILGNGGWRNKHQISSATGLSSRKVYDKNGIIERLVNLGLLEVRDAPTEWGRQANQYRANTNHVLIKSIYNALLRSQT